MVTRRARGRAVAIGGLLAFVAANVALWGFGLADHLSRSIQTRLFIGDAFCIGTLAMFLSGPIPFSMRLFRSGGGRPPSTDETLEKLTE
jgi:hypothetical protein